MDQWKTVTILLTITLVSVGIVSLYAFKQDSGVSVSPAFQGVTIEGPSLLGVNASGNYRAIVSGSNSGHLDFAWNITPQDNMTVLEADGANCTLTIIGASEKVYNLTVHVKDMDSGSLGTAFIIVFDPYTHPNRYVGDMAAPYSFLIQSDGYGWYEAINGTDGSTTFSSTDFSTTMQYALDAMAVSGGEIFLRNPSDSIYSASKTIVVYPNITIQGENKKATMIRKDFNGDLFKVTTRSGAPNAIGFFVISDVSLNGNKAHYPTGDGINITLYDSHVERCYINNFNTGIHIDGEPTATYYVWIADNHIEMNNIGVFVHNASNIFVQNNIISENTQDGINVNGTYSYSLKIEGNTILHNGYNGLNMASGGAYSTVVGNIFEDNGFVTPNSYYSLRQYGSGAWITVTGNTFKTNANLKYVIDVYTYSPPRTVIEGNTFDSPGLSGYILLEGAGGAGAVIFANVGFVTENSGFQNGNATDTTFTIAHGLSGTPTGVWASFNDTGIICYTWTANATSITVTVTGTPANSVMGCYWNAVYKP